MSLLECLVTYLLSVRDVLSVTLHSEGRFKLKAGVSYANLFNYALNCEYCADQFETSASPRVHPGHLTVQRAQGGGNLNQIYLLF